MAEPTSTANGGSIDSTKANVASTASSLSEGPVATTVSDQAQKTKNEFSNLGASRTTPSQPAATGQPLTHYHSFFSELLSWKNTRASSIAFVSAVSLIFAVRYLDVIRWGFKLTWMALGVTIAAEVAGKAILSNGFATQLRPRRYYTVPKETLDAVIGDVHELINFFVIEAQRILFAENILASSTAFLGAFVSYYLVKIVPYWGLALLGTCLAFLVPLLYTSNQELIDNQIAHASEIINAQTAQIKQVAGKHTAAAADLTKQYMGDYTSKAQQILRSRTGATPAPASKTYKASDFPDAPKEPLAGKTTGAQPEPVAS